MARLMQHGSKLGRPAAAEKPPSKLKQGSSKQGTKKQVGKGEIPAPLAGLLPEANHCPKRKNKTVSRARMHPWAMVQELPESPLAILARKLEVAGRISIEAHPAWTPPVVHAVPGGEAMPGERFEPAASAAVVAEPGPGPGPEAASARELDPDWRNEGAAGEPAPLQQGPAEPQALRSMLLDTQAASPVRAVGGGIAVEPSPCGASIESCSPRMIAALGSGLEATEAGAAQQEIAAGTDSRFSDFEPAPCGLVVLPAVGVRSTTNARSPLVETRAGAECCPLAPQTGIAPARAAIRHVGSLMDVEPAARLATPFAFKSREKALGPRRRLIGPRVKGEVDWVWTLPEAGPAVPGEPAPLRAGRVCRPGVEAPMELASAEPRIPAAWATGHQMEPGLAELAEMTGHRPRVCCGTEQALVTALPGWRVETSRIPATGFSVEEPLMCKPEVAAPAVPDPEIQRPPLFDRLLPIFACRGLDWRRAERGTVEFAQGPDWDLALSRPPLNRASSLTVDHADGSGSRMAAAASESNRPWYSIQLPSFQFASWKRAPADLKWIMVALPMILMIALYSFLPPRTKNSVETAAGTPAQPTVLSQRFEAMRTAIMERAAIRLADDFRSGLGAWQGPGGWAQTWTYNSANYAVPGQLALYQPSLGLQDYVFSFLGQIDRRSINWVVRARDERNYLAMRIVMTRSGPLPAASLVRYAVVGGRMRKQTVLPLPMAFRDGTMQQVEVTVAGETITTRVMGQIVDSFTETELDSGGVGFFSPKGDRALLRWLSVTHQYDYVGRLCALLAPHAVISREARRVN